MPELRSPCSCSSLAFLGNGGGGATPQYTSPPAAWTAAHSPQFPLEAAPCSKAPSIECQPCVCLTENLRSDLGTVTDRALFRDKNTGFTREVTWPRPQHSLAPKPGWPRVLPPPRQAAPPFHALPCPRATPSLPEPGPYLRHSQNRSNSSGMSPPGTRLPCGNCWVPGPGPQSLLHLFLSLSCSGAPRPRDWVWGAPNRLWG